MHKFLEAIFTFNDLGGCSQEQSYENLGGGVDLVEEEVEEVKDSIFNFLKGGERWTIDNRADLLDSIIDTMVVSVGVGYRAGFNMQQIKLAMKVVADANLDKYCYSEEDAVESVEAYEGDDRYTNVRYEENVFDNKPYYVIVGDTAEGNRKILKASAWEDPKENLKQIIGE